MNEQSCILRDEQFSKKTIKTKYLSQSQTNNSKILTDKIVNHNSSDNKT